MRILVAGATGAIGRSLVRRLVTRGDEVFGLTRSIARAADLQEQGATAVIGDALELADVRRAVENAQPDVVINELTDLPQRLNPLKLSRYYAANNRVRREGTANLLAACRAADVKRIVVQSVAFWYAPCPGRLHREEDPLFLEAPEPIGGAVKTLAEVEHSSMEAFAGETVILRYGFFYGDGTWYARDGDVGKQVRGWRYPIIGKGTGVFSFVHIDDAAEATVAALTAPGGIYNIVDDDPAPLAQWLPVFADALGARKPIRAPAAIARMAAGTAPVVWLAQLQGADNAHAKARLGWRPQHPTWRTGFYETLQEDAVT